jgi:sugar phosphate isomerase/epimerase
MNRRHFVATLAGLAMAAAPPLRPRFTLGFSTYGMPGWTTENALDTIAATGFDTVELCLLPAYDSAPEKLTPARRRDLRRRLDDLGLGLPAFMESLVPSPDNTTDTKARDRLKRAADLAHTLRPTGPPLIETVLGSGDWGKLRTLYRDRLGGWLDALGTLRLAIKPHRFGAMSLPAHAAWLIQQIASPRLQMVFDQSHYEYRDHNLANLIRDAANQVAFVAVKDVTRRDGKVTFELPGSTGTPDHVAVLQALISAGYQGDINAEVSGMVFNRPKYDAKAAALHCHKTMTAWRNRIRIPGN